MNDRLKAQSERYYCHKAKSDAKKIANTRNIPVFLYKTGFHFEALTIPDITRPPFEVIYP